MLPSECQELCDSCCADVRSAIDDPSRDHSTRRVVGASFAFPALSEEVILAVVRNTLDTVLKVAGQSAVNATLAYKDAIRKLVTPLALSTIDQIVHGLQDAK